MFPESSSAWCAVGDPLCQPHRAHVEIAPLGRRPSATADDFAITSMLTFRDIGKSLQIVGSPGLSTRPSVLIQRTGDTALSGKDGLLP